MKRGEEGGREEGSQRHRANTEHSPKGGTTSMKFVNGFQSYHKESKLAGERNELQDLLNQLA